MNPKVIGIGILVLAVIAVAVMQLNKPDTNNDTTQTLVTPTVVTTTENTEGADYIDGVYEATGNYTSPAGEEEIDVNVTLQDGVVTEAVFMGKATHDVGKKLQKLFSEGFEEQVVGKSIDDIALTVVNGSSLTPKGFMDALEKVKTEAAQS